MDNEQIETHSQPANKRSRLLIYLLLGITVFSVSFWIFQQPYQREVDTLQQTHLTTVRIDGLNTHKASSGETTYEITFSEGFSNTFRAETNHSTYQQLTVGQETPLYFNESLGFALLEAEMTQLHFAIWIVLLLLFSIIVVAIFYGVGKVYKRFRKRGQPERPLSELYR